MDHGSEELFSEREEETNDEGTYQSSESDYEDEPVFSLRSSSVRVFSQKTVRAVGQTQARDIMMNGRKDETTLG